ncbi:MAG: hypothetical protein IK090_05930 [Clostridia bacterium]|nr:hypothetical protein [Clostridia bacterium]
MEKHTMQELTVLHAPQRDENEKQNSGYDQQKHIFFGYSEQLYFRFDILNVPLEFDRQDQREEERQQNQFQRDRDPDLHEGQFLEIGINETSDRKNLCYSKQGSKTDMRFFLVKHFLLPACDFSTKLQS